MTFYNATFRILLALFVAMSVRALAQTCIPNGTRPVVPPTPTQATVQLPPDGGTVGCTFTAFCPGCTGAQTAFTVGNAKCATMVGMAQQAAAIDNGWSDGGVP